MADFQKVEVSTNSLSFFNNERVLLKLTFLGDALTVGIWFPEVVDGKATYPKALRHQVILTKENVESLTRDAMKDFIPKLEDPESVKGIGTGVFTNRNSTQVMTIWAEGGIIQLQIADEIENRIPKNVYMYKFEKTRVIKNYNISAVSFEIEEIDAQFFLFFKTLLSFTDLCSGITAHEYRLRNQYFNDSVRKHLEALNLKFGLGIQGYNPNSNGGGSSSFGGSNFESGNSYNTMENMGSPVAVTQGSMNDLFPGAGPELPFN